MKLNLIPKNPRKIPFNIALIVLTAGASLILGFLSFGGMYALLPFLPLAFAGFALSVSYEGEIYLQNIKGALKKLFKTNYLEHYLAKEYLLEHFPKNTRDKNCPLFFKDYEIQLHLLSKFSHHDLNERSRAEKKQIGKTLSDMEKWFALQLFASERKAPLSDSAYARELNTWLVEHHQQDWQDKLQKRTSLFRLVQGFSVFSALFMGLGSTYLIVEAFSIIPLFALIPFAFWPLLIVPMALVAGTAYGLLTYNAVTDLINNNTVLKWYNKLRDNLRQGLTLRNVTMVTIAVLLVSLALALTICTAGTWWTVASNARPLFDWMSRMPSFIMGLINPIITGISAVCFNIQNSAESLDMIDRAFDSPTNIFVQLYTSLKEGVAHIRETEHWTQWINPFRIILKLTITPLRVILFLGHLLSIAVTADRMPGVPQIISALVAIISEGFEDAHYFAEVGHNHYNGESANACCPAPHQQATQSFSQSFCSATLTPEMLLEERAVTTAMLLKERLDPSSSHQHTNDLPTLSIKTIAIPIYALAAGWDWLASQLNRQGNEHSPNKRRPLTFAQAWNKQRSIAEERDIMISEHTKRPSLKWQKEHLIGRIEQFKNKHLAPVTIGKELAQEKINQLNDFQTRIRKCPLNKMSKELAKEKANPVYNQQRLFPVDDQSRTQRFVAEELPVRIGLRA